MDMDMKELMAEFNKSLKSLVDRVGQLTEGQNDQDSRLEKLDFKISYLTDFVKNIPMKATSVESNNNNDRGFSSKENDEPLLTKQTESKETEVVNEESKTEGLGLDDFENKEQSVVVFTGRENPFLPPTISARTTPPIDFTDSDSSMDDDTLAKQNQDKNNESSMVDDTEQNKDKDSTADLLRVLEDDEKSKDSLQEKNHNDSLTRKPILLSSDSETVFDIVTSKPKAEDSEDDDLFVALKKKDTHSVFDNGDVLAENKSFTEPEAEEENGDQLETEKNKIDSDMDLFSKYIMGNNARKRRKINTDDDALSKKFDARIEKLRRKDPKLNPKAFSVVVKRLPKVIFERLKSHHSLNLSVNEELSDGGRGKKYSALTEAIKKLGAPITVEATRKRSGSSSKSTKSTRRSGKRLTRK